MRDESGDLTFAWPAPIQSEEEMVYDLLKRGRLKSCKLNGAIRIDSELRTIRESWLHEIRSSLFAEDHVPKITRALPTWGCPPWFYKAHAPGSGRRCSLVESTGWRAVGTRGGGRPALKSQLFYGRS